MYKAAVLSLFIEMIDPLSQVSLEQSCDHQHLNFSDTVP
jgi:hypothetical protein